MHCHPVTRTTSRATAESRYCRQANDRLSPPGKLRGEHVLLDAIRRSARQGQVREVKIGSSEPRRNHNLRKGTPGIASRAGPRRAAPQRSRTSMICTAVTWLLKACSRSRCAAAVTSPAEFTVRIGSDMKCRTRSGPFPHGVDVAATSKFGFRHPLDKAKSSAPSTARATVVVNNLPNVFCQH